MGEEPFPYYNRMLIENDILLDEYRDED